MWLPEREFRALPLLFPFRVLILATNWWASFASLGTSWLALTMMHARTCNFVQGSCIYQNHTKKSANPKCLKQVRAPTYRTPKDHAWSVKTVQPHDSYFCVIVKARIKLEKHNSEIIETVLNLRDNDKLSMNFDLMYNMINEFLIFFNKVLNLLPNI